MSRYKFLLYFVLSVFIFFVVQELIFLNVPLILSYSSSSAIFKYISGVCIFLIVRHNYNPAKGLSPLSIGLVVCTFLVYQQYLQISIAYILYMLGIVFFEEVVFRHAFWELAIYYKISYHYILLWSALLFGLLHLVNFYYGDPLNMVLFQMAYTTMMGLSLGYVYFATRSLLLVTLMHTVINITKIPLDSFNVYLLFLVGFAVVGFALLRNKRLFLQ